MLLLPPSQQGSKEHGVGAAQSQGAQHIRDRKKGKLVLKGFILPVLEAESRNVSCDWARSLQLRDGKSELTPVGWGCRQGRGGAGRVLE